MPSTNPLVAFDDEHVAATPVIQQSSVSAHASVLGGVLMNPSGSASATNAAGTSENIAMHIAFIVALALIGVYVFRASGFKFVVAGSIGSR